MTISSRTPEGLPSHCPLCGADVAVEYAEPAGDACCPRCGALLWAAEQIKGALLKHHAELAYSTSGEVSLTSPMSDLGYDSLEMVELVMALEDEVNIDLPDEGMNRLSQAQTLEELIRMLSQWVRPRRDG